MKQEEQLTPEEQQNFIYNLTLHFFEEWEDTITENTEAKKLLETYSSLAKLPKESPLCMMFVAFAGGMEKAFKLVNDMDGGKTTA